MSDPHDDGDEDQDPQGMLARLLGGMPVIMAGPTMESGPRRTGEQANFTVHLSVGCRKSLGLALNLMNSGTEAWQAEEAFLLFRIFIDTQFSLPFKALAHFKDFIVPLDDGLVASIPTSVILSTVDDTGTARRRHENGEDVPSDLATEDKDVLRKFLEKTALPLDLSPPYSFLRDAFEASDDECILVQALHLLLKASTASSMVPVLKAMRSDPEGSLGRFTGMPRERVEAVIKEGKLRTIGLLIRADHPTILLGRTEPLRNIGDTPYLDLHPGLDHALDSSTTNLDTFLSSLRGRKIQQSENPLSWNDFAHVGPLADMSARLLSSVGGSVLLVGPPGSGKTEFALALARRLGRPAYSIGERDQGGKEPKRGERFASLKAAIALSGDSPILLVEEAEDMLQVPTGATDRFGFSKSHLNHFLDNVKSPVIWTTNSTQHIDPATLRRMSMIVPFGDVSSAVRERIWNRALAREGQGMEGVDTHALAREWNATAGLCATAIRTARDSNSGVEGIGHVLDGFSRVIGGLRSREDTAPPPFDPDLCETQESLDGMLDLLRKAGPGPWSMCLYGPPGTGKSAFARHVAHALGMEWMLVRASDLLDMYVGNTEKKIADAFSKARMERKALVFDEADSMLSARDGARQSWERTQVNEMLTQMEYHPLPFFATTNLMEGLDKASLRRFTFKMEFLDLSAAKARLAFERILGVPVPQEASLPHNVSPGDMAGLLKRKRILGVTDPEVLVRWLWEESEIKEGKRRSIGFAKG